MITSDVDQAAAAATDWSAELDAARSRVLKRVDAMAEAAKREIRSMAVRDRRSLGQMIRWRRHRYPHIYDCGAFFNRGWVKP